MAAYERKKGGEVQSPRIHRLIRDDRVLATAGAIAFGVIFSIPLLGGLGTPGRFIDWDYNLGLQWVAYHTVVHFHQLPLWNPYKCGGMAMLTNPGSHVATPWFILTLMFGAFAGIHLEIPIHIAIAWAGGYVLARVVGIRPLAAALSACVFPASSWYYLHLGAGQIWALAYVYTPWFLAMAWRASDRGDIRYAVAAGGALALSFLEGNPYPPAFAVVTAAIVLSAMALMQRSIWPLAVLVIATLFAIGFSAIKLFPGYLVSIQHPRLDFQLEADSWMVMRSALFSRV